MFIDSASATGSTAHTRLPATIEGKSFGQKRPPLSVIIKGILEKYPDGQIFKVLTIIQHVTDQSYCKGLCSLLFNSKVADV